MADATRRVSIRLSLDDGARVKTELRDVGETGQRSLDRIKDGAESASRGLDLLNTAVRAVQVVALGAGLRQLVQAGDALTQSMFRLANATGSVAAAADVYQQLLHASLQTGVAVTESADAFQRFSVAARAIGATNSEVARLVTGLQASAIVSGASAQEVGSATLQLAQGLASGVLQGDELRSVLESMPLLAEELARQLGVSVGELRKMGERGELVAGRTFPALLGATDELGRKLENAPLTVDRAFGQLRVSTQNFLGQLDQAIGLSNLLARALSGAATALDGVRQGAGLTTPGEDLARRRAALDGVRGQIAQLEGPPAAAPRPGTVRQGLVATAQQQAGVDRAAQLRELRAAELALMVEIEDAERAAALRGFDEVQAARQRAQQANRDRTSAAVEPILDRLDPRRRISREFDASVAAINAAEASGALDAAEAQRALAAATRERDEALRRLEGTTNRAGGAQRESNAVDREGAEAAREVNDALRERDALIRQNETALERYARRMDALGTLSMRAEGAGQPIPDETIAREAAAALDELEQAQNRLNRSTERGADVARELGLTFSSAFEDAILRGKSLGDVLQGLAQDIARIVLRQTVTNPLASAVSRVVEGFDFGGVMRGLFGGTTATATTGATVTVPGRASGGPVAAGMPYIVGERGPEWFVPSEAGTVLPNGVGLGGVTFAPTYNIDARGADAGMLPRLRAEMAAIARASVAELEERVNRGGAAARTFGRRA